MKRRVMRGGEDESPSDTKDQPESSGAGELFETWFLTIPLITDLIFAELSYSDLLNCSLVSKAWNLSCREILVDGFRTYLTLSEKSTVESLEEFNNLIRDVVPEHNHPVNGIRIKFNDSLYKWPFSSEPFVDLLNQIIEQMQVKCVSFEMGRLYLEAPDYHDIFKTLVIPHLGTIEFLEILNFEKNMEIFSNELKVDSLLNLKELNFGNTLDRLKSSSTFKRILKACPNLKTFPAVPLHQLPTLRCTNNLHLASKVRFDIWMTSTDLQLLRDYSPLIKHLEINPNHNGYLIHCEADYISKLEALFVLYFQHSLESLHIDVRPLIEIILHGTFPPLRNVKELWVRGGRFWLPNFFKNKTVRCAQFLPNLKAVTLIWTPESTEWLHMKYGPGYFFESRLAALRECQTTECLESVTKLRIDCSKGYYLFPFDMSTDIMDLDQFFPNVTQLEIHMDILVLENLLQWICESWGDCVEILILRVIQCLGFRPNSPRGFDHHWRELLEIKRKNLHPGTKYSYKLSHLRCLELKFCHPTEERDCTGGNCVDDKVKAQVAFEPRPGHNVDLIISGCRANKRMRSVKSGVSIYDTIIALYACPRNLELSAMEKIIADKLICRTICRMLPSADLRSCRNVSRSWDAVAREVFYKRGSFTLTLEAREISEYSSTQNVGRQTLDKLAWLARGNLKSFSRLRIQYDWSPQRYIYSTSEDFSCLMERLDFTQTSFKVLEVRDIEESIPREEWFQITDHILKACKPLFQKLNVQRVPKLVTSIEMLDRLRDEQGNFLLSNLQSIEFLEPEKLLEHPQMFRKLLEGLSNLERIDVPFSNKLLPLVSSVGKAHCVKHIQLYKIPDKGSVLGQAAFPIREDSDAVAAEDPRTDLGFLLEFVEKHEMSRIESLFIGSALCGRAFQELAPDLRRVFQPLCTSSHESLQTLNLNLPFLHFISGLITRPLVALKIIELRSDEVEFDSQGLLAQIPFSDMSPNLEAVKLTRDIHFSPDSVPEEQSSGCKMWELWPTRTCSSVKFLEYKIKIEAWSCSYRLIPKSAEPWIMEYVSKVFPNITKLSFSVPYNGAANGIPAALRSIWKTWPGVEILELDADLDGVSFESSVLGISEEEWRAWIQVLGYEADVLNSMQYAPSTCSIRNCKNLKELWISPHVRTGFVRLSRAYGRYVLFL